MDFQHLADDGSDDYLHRTPSYESALHDPHPPVKQRGIC